MNNIDDKISKIISDEISRKINNEISKSLNENKYSIIIAGQNSIPYTIIKFINKMIEHELEDGYILCNILCNDEEDYIKIPLSELHSISYVYDPSIAKDKVIRFHQTEEEYKRLNEPTLDFEDKDIIYKYQYNQFLNNDNT